MNTNKGKPTAAPKFSGVKLTRMISSPSGALERSISASAKTGWAGAHPYRYSKFVLVLVVVLVLGRAFHLRIDELPVIDFEHGACAQPYQIEDEDDDEDEDESVGYVCPIRGAHSLLPQASFKSSTEFIRDSAVNCGQRVRTTGVLGAVSYHGNWWLIIRNDITRRFCGSSFQPTRGNKENETNKHSSGN
jgi:hypothetical protein